MISATTTDDNNDQRGGGGDMISSKKECTSCEHTEVVNITEGINSIAIQDDISTCANCGKEGNSCDMNTCNKCKSVKYCNAACKKKHRHKHKKDCERKVAELHDEMLFKQPPPKEDCPICYLRMPTLITGHRYQTCCGKVICCGCYYAPVFDNQGNEVDINRQNECPFCRTLAPKSNEEAIKRLNKLLKAGDTSAIYNLGGCYAQGINGLTQDYTKALELWHRAAELGDAAAYNVIGYSYSIGEGVEIDKKKAIHYYELAAMTGDEFSRHSLGNHEKKAGNMDRALKHYMIAVGGGYLKHYMIAVRGGYSDSLQQVKSLYSNGHASKEDYTKALQLYQSYLGEITSPQRDEAAADTDEEYRYY